ncbi:MAG TPA: S8 family serine peptidase [Roseiflexaceae bacterium]|nr:S8 family serine peptidase [Roseiflexaceae bacterium]
MHIQPRRIVATALLLTMLLSGGIVHASPRQLQQVAPIRLKAATLTPGLGRAAQIPAGLAAAERAGRAGYYLVQFRGPVEESWKKEALAQGAELLEYLPDFAFKARMTPAVARQLAASANVAWVGLFEPDYKLSPALKRTGTQLYKLRIERGADLAQANAALAQSGAVTVAAENDLLVVAADAAQLSALAAVPDVAWIENFAFQEKHNEYGGGTIIGANTANTNGYDGSTQINAVADTGIGGGTAATAHRDIPAGRIVAIQNFPGASSGSCYSVVNDGAADVDSGHGTHVAGSVLSDGKDSSDPLDPNDNTPIGLGKGVAPAARLVFQAVENYIDFKGICALSNPDGYYLIGIPTDLHTLFQQAYNAGARIHSNSWGSAAAGDYTTDSVNADDFIWDNKDMTITFSAGNEGIDANADGVIDSDSIGSPATAKNVISIGASENDRVGNYQCDTGLGYQSRDLYQPNTTCSGMGGQNILGTYGVRWPADYPANPIKDDPTAGNAQQMAGFSSRGPTDDTRIKPDVVAPGTWILSTYSGQHQEGYGDPVNPQNGVFQVDGWGMPRNGFYKYFGGTSMSNPIAGGGASVVRDFYQKAYGAYASAALVKATLINSAVDLLDENNDGVDDNDFPIPNVHEGWGRINLVNATDGSAKYVDNSTGTATNAATTYTANVGAAGSPLKVSLVWSDFASTAAAAVNLVNDLDLEVTAPDGTTVYRGNVFSGGWSTTGGAADRRNNVENVYLPAASAGNYSIIVRGFNVPSGPQPYALVVDGATTLTGPLDTGLQSPTAHAAVTTGSGDNNGFQTSAGNALTDNSSFAVDTNSGNSNSTSCTSTNKDRHTFTYNITSVPATATILGIQVRLDARVDATNGAPNMCVQLSSDGGATWTTATRSTPTLTTSEATYLLGGSSDLWGRGWTPANVTGTNFRVRITNVASSTSRDFSLDWVAVNVYYQ